MAVTRRFLNWDAPLSIKAAELLYSEAVREPFGCDYSHLEIVLPTAEAERIVREELALKSNLTGFHPVRPDFYREQSNASTPARILNDWILFLKDVRADDYPTLFPNDALLRFQNDSEGLLKIAAKLQKTREDLALEGLSLDGVIAVLEENCRASDSEIKREFIDRYREFSVLEKRFLNRFHGMDSVGEILEKMRTWTPSGTVRKIILIGCPLLKNGTVNALRNCGIETEIWIHAPQSAAAWFDDYGRPVPAAWRNIPVDLDLSRRVRCMATPEEEAEYLYSLLKSGVFRPESIGMVDPEIISALQHRCALRNDSPRIYMPQTRPLSSLPWSRLYLQIAALCERSFDLRTVSALFRNPCFLYQWPDPEKLLSAFDELQKKHLTGDFSFFQKKAAGSILEKPLAALERLRLELLSSDCPWEKVSSVFQEWGARFPLTFSEEDERELSALSSAVTATEEVSSEEPFPLLRHILSESMVPSERIGTDAVTGVGFMELPWQRDSIQLIAGLNEENIEQGALSDYFLPDRLCGWLGMRNAEARHAVDQFFFKALSEHRDLRILFGKTSQSGEVRRPARILFSCRDPELPERVDLLFSDDLLFAPPFVPETPFPLLRPAKPVLGKKTMSVTGFQQYLACPFSYYMRNILRVEERNDRSFELDPRDYGTLVHSVLEAYGRHNKDGLLRTPGDIDAFCQAALRKRMESLFDSASGIPRIQLDLISASLQYFAEAEAAELAAGWNIIDVEQKIDDPWKNIYHFFFPEEPKEEWRNEIRLVGKIDRIDRRIHPDGASEFRIIDYKTFSKAENPKKTHFGTLSSVGFQVPVPEMKNVFWSNLQLPVYDALLKYKFKMDDPVATGYFNLPLEFTETGFQCFKELESSSEIRLSALKCADDILHRVFVDGIFWPPGPKTNVLDPYYPEIDPERFEEPSKWENSLC